MSSCLWYESCRWLITINTEGLAIINLLFLISQTSLHNAIVIIFWSEFDLRIFTNMFLPIYFVLWYLHHFEHLLLAIQNNLILSPQITSSSLEGMTSLIFVISLNHTFSYDKNVLPLFLEKFIGHFHTKCYTNNIVQCNHSLCSQGSHSAVWTHTKPCKLHPQHTQIFYPFDDTVQKPMVKFHFPKTVYAILIF